MAIDVRKLQAQLDALEERVAKLERDAKAKARATKSEPK